MRSAPLLPTAQLLLWRDKKIEKKFICASEFFSDVVKNYFFVMCFMNNL
jgi:hypothetical protein